MALLTCKKCGAQWDTASTPPMLYFLPKVEGQSRRDLTSPAEILAAGLEIEFCPKCPMPRLDDAMRRGDRRGSDEEN